MAQAELSLQTGRPARGGSFFGCCKTRWRPMIDVVVC